MRVKSRLPGLAQPPVQRSWPGPQEVYIRRVWRNQKADTLGRLTWCCDWVEPDGVFRREASRCGDGPVGHRRSQIFFVPLADLRKQWAGKRRVVVFEDEFVTEEQ